MSIKNYLINSPEKINKLKSDLMSRNSDSSINMESLSSSFNQFQNTQIEPLIEDNIIKTLTNIYGWKEINHPRSFYYRILEYEEKKDIYIENYAKELSIEDVKLVIADNFVTIKNLDGKQEEIKLKDEEINKFVIGEKNVAIRPRQKIEVDGIFLAKSVDISKFNKEEIELIYNNVDINDLEKYEYIIIEIAMSQKKIDALNEQLIRKKFVFELINKKENLFLCFTTAKDINFNSGDKMKGINFILLGFKNFYFGEWKIDEYLDWKTIQDLCNLEKEINKRFDILENKILNELKDIKKMISELKERIKLSSSSNSKYQNNEGVNDKKMKKKKERDKSQKAISIPIRQNFLKLKRHRIPYLRYLLQQNIKMKNSKKK